MLYFNPKSNFIHHILEALSDNIEGIICSSLIKLCHYGLLKIIKKNLYQLLVTLISHLPDTCDVGINIS